jgi:hypothetical protein
LIISRCFTLVVSACKGLADAHQSADR